MVDVALVMPKLSMTMTEGTFLLWHKAEGDRVRQGEVVCEVATDKVDMEVEATVDGTLTRLVAAPEDVIEVGAPIAYVAAESDDLLAGLLDEPAGLRPPNQRYRAAPTKTGASGPSVAGSGAAGSDSAAGGPELSDPARRLDTGGRRPTEELAAAPDAAAAGSAPRPSKQPAAVPAARRQAAEHGIDLATIHPTGPWNTIRLSDVDSVRKPRTTMARRMAASAAIPQLVLYRDLNLEPSDHSWTTLFTQAFAAALRQHPHLNATWADNEPLHHDHVTVAIAVDTPRGLIAPVLTDPDRLDAGRIDDLTARATAGRLNLAELTTQATTTICVLDVNAHQTLLTPPQATALAVGTPQHRVVPVPGGIGVQLRCTVALTVDHRVADGAAGARLLATLQELI